MFHVKQVGGKMEIIKVKIEDIKPYENNAKLHPQEQIEQIKKSILEFGNNDPIAIDENNIIIEGHGRYEALKQLDYKEVECIKLSHLTEEQKKAYILVHNKLTMNTGFDLDILNEELEQIENIDMGDFDFDLGLDVDFDISEDEDVDDKYTQKVDIPQYQMTGELPNIIELVDKNKLEELINDINKSNVNEEQKEFLRMSAYRHLTFNYSKIAEYYAHQNKEMQELMEKSALVIIDYNDAIKNGFVELTKRFEEIEEEDEIYNNENE